MNPLAPTTHVQPVSLSSFDVVGLAVRTTNQEAATTIPALWARVMAEVLPHRPEDALDEPGALVAVYDAYESDHTGPYTLTVGFPIKPDSMSGRPRPLPPDWTRVQVSAADYARFPVEADGPSGIFGAWERVWKDTALPRTFRSDLEVYPARSEEEGAGRPEVLIGVRDLGTKVVK
jgi:predicted transcriptional regulator YdeE